MTVEDWKKRSEELLPDSLFICTSCGVINRYFKWVCELCEAKGESQRNSESEPIPREVEYFEEG